LVVSPGGGCPSNRHIVARNLPDSRISPASRFTLTGDSASPARCSPATWRSASLAARQRGWCLRV